MKAKINGKDVDFSLDVGRKLMGKSNGQDLGDLESGVAMQMFLDPEAMAHAVWANFQDRLIAAGVQTDSEFFELLDGETSRKVTNAMKESITDFFPWGKMVVEQVEKRLANLGAAVDQLSQSGHLSGNTLGSSE